MIFLSYRGMPEGGSIEVGNVGREGAVGLIASAAFREKWLAFDLISPQEALSFARCHIGTHFGVYYAVEHEKCRKRHLVALAFEWSGRQVSPK